MKKLSLLLLFSILISVSLFAQNRTIKGKVTDDAGTALPGVNVVPTGSKAGVQTDKDGNFTLTVTGSPNLQITYVGFQVKTVSTSGNDNLKISLEKIVSSGEEVVVIGYQAVKRKDLLASVSSIGAKDLKDIPINNAAEALNGRLAGVTATTSEGSPDANVRIRVRGGMSITGSNEPLYIIDGVQIESGLSTISPQDIQTIDVLKDAAATAIYGARGANGVIIITTKSGKPGRTIVSYNGLLGIRKLSNTLEVLSPYGFVEYQLERATMLGGQDLINFQNNFGTTYYNPKL